MSFCKDSSAKHVDSKKRAFHKYSNNKSIHVIMFKCIWTVTPAKTNQKYLNIVKVNQVKAILAKTIT